jgi:hypothetical protein
LEVQTIFNKDFCGVFKMMKMGIEKMPGICKDLMRCGTEYFIFPGEKQ